MRHPVDLPREKRRGRLERDAHVNVLVAANRFEAAVEALCREEGISHHQYVALWVLCLDEATDHGLPVSRIADGLLTRASDVTRLVRRLEQSGLAERGSDPDDGRVVLVRATARGRELFSRLARRLRGFHRSQWESLDDTELAQLDELLRRVLWHGQSADDPG